MRTKNGIGVRAKLVIDCTALRASWARPGSPPRNSAAPITLMARNENATGRPRPMTAIRPPNRTRLACVHCIAASADRGCFGAARALKRQAVEAEHEFDGDQQEGRGE